MNGVEGSPKEQLDDEEKKKIYRIIANAQLKAWNKGWIGWDSWDLGRCVDFSWFPTEK